MTTKVTKELLADGSVGSAQLIDGSVIETKYANNSIPAGAFKDASIGGVRLINDTIGGEKLLDGSITSAKYGVSSIPLTAFADGLITGIKIANLTITSDHLSADSVTGPKISNSAVSGPKIENEAVTSSKLATNSVISNKIQDQNITLPKLQPLPEGSLISFSSSQAIAISPGSNGQALVMASGRPAWGTVGMPTGLIMDYFGTNPPTGWVAADGQTIGNTNSTANFRDVSARALFLHLWNSFNNTFAQVMEGRGASAVADWDANKKIKLPDLRGRTTVGVENDTETPSNRISTANFGSTVTQVGNTGGAEKEALTIDQIPDHRHHSVLNTDLVGSLPTEFPATTSVFYRAYDSFYNLAFTEAFINPGSGLSSAPVSPDGFGPANYGQTHNNIQPSILVLKIIKL